MQKCYAFLSQFTDVILQQQGKGNMAGILVDSVTRTQKIKMGGYDIVATLGRGTNVSVAL